MRYMQLNGHMQGNKSASNYATTESIQKLKRNKSLKELGLIQNGIIQLNEKSISQSKILRLKK
jgi:hypothetical protein